MSKFPVFEILVADLPVSKQTLRGAVEKYWIEVPEIGRCLLKLEEPTTNGAWVEKITSEVAKVIGIPTATYELVRLSDGRKGILSPNYLSRNCDEITGKQCLEDCLGVGNYRYSVETVIDTIDSLDLVLPKFTPLPLQIQSSSDLFVGYLLFDYLVDNFDRHYENWGIEIDNVSGQKQLLPNYDNGLGLGFLMFEEEAAQVDPASYVLNQASAFQKSQGRSLPMVELLAEVITLKPEAAQAWSERIRAIEPEFIIELFQRIPAGWVSESAQGFAVELIEFNREQIGLICEAMTATQLSQPDLLDPTIVDKSAIIDANPNLDLDVDMDFGA